MVKGYVPGSGAPLGGFTGGPTADASLGGQDFADLREIPPRFQAELRDFDVSGSGWTNVQFYSPAWVFPYTTTLQPSARTAFPVPPVRLIAGFRGRSELYRSQGGLLWVPWASQEWFISAELPALPGGIALSPPTVPIRIISVVDPDMAEVMRPDPGLSAYFASGTASSAGSSFGAPCIAFDAGRDYLFIQNQGVADMWVFPDNGSTPFPHGWQLKASGGNIAFDARNNQRVPKNALMTYCATTTSFMIGVS